MEVITEPIIAADDLGAETIRSFCGLYHLSEAHYYAESRRGNMPKTIRVGRRTLIPRAAIRAWLEQKVAAAGAGTPVIGRS